MQVEFFTVRMQAPSLTVRLLPVQVGFFTGRVEAHSLTAGLMPMRADVLKVRANEASLRWRYGRYKVDSFKSRLGL